MHLKKFLFVFIAYASATAFAATAPNTADLSWQYNNTSGDPANDNPTFIVYQGLQGAAKTAVGNTTTKAFSISSGLQFGQTYCWDVTSKVGTNESAHSVEACKTFPSPVPSIPMGVQVK